MKYYKINFALSTKVIGNGNYIKDYKLKIPPVAGQLYWEVPKFIGNIYNEKIDFEPYLLDIELYANSKVNDLIMDGGPISGKLVLSSRLKRILESFRKDGMQFFNIHILKKSEIYSDYWILSMHGPNPEYIDFKNCEIIYEQKAKDYSVSYHKEKKNIQVNSCEEFEEYIKLANIQNETISIEKLKLNESIIKEDFFTLKYIPGYYVSEKLKREIEKAGCIGIEFQPSNSTLNEWLSSGGEREMMYGKI